MTFLKNRKIKIIIYCISAVLFMGFAAYVGTNYLIKASVEDNGSNIASSSNYNIHSSAGQSITSENSSASYKNYEGYIPVTYSFLSSVDNNPPTANAGLDTSVYKNELARLNATGSGDADGDPLTYKWTQINGSYVTLNDTSSAQPTFTPEAEGEYVFQLEVTDTGGLSDTDSVTITANYKYMLGDFNTDKSIDFEDLSQFAIYWKSDNISGDIGPRKTGETAPFYFEDVSLDNKLDYKDLLVFTFNWDYLIDNPAYAIKKALKYFSIARAISGSIQFDLKKVIGTTSNQQARRYKIISKGYGDFLGCYINLHSINCNIQGPNLTAELAKNKFIMLPRTNENNTELNIVSLNKKDYYINSGVEIADFEVTGKGDIVLSYLIKNNDNIAVSYAVERYSMQERSEKEIAGTTLGQNFPNPFNPETWIPFSLSEPGDVKIIIYNLVGQKIREISLGYRQAGEYKTKDKAAFWNGLNNSGDEAASGIYFYKLITGSYSSIKRMVVLK